MRFIALLLCMLSAQAFAACPQIYDGVSYSCSVVAGTVDAGSAGTTGEYKVGVETNELFVQPRYNGVRKLFSAATSPIIFTSYPSNIQWGQFLIVIDTDASTVTLHHIKDTSPDYKQDWSLANNIATGSGCTNGQWCLRVRFYDPAVPTVDEITFAGTTDWRVAAQYYKDWAQQQSWYVSHGALAGEELGHVTNCSTNAYSYYDANLDGIPAIFSPKRVGCFMTQYRTDTFDVDYPDYTCSAGANCPAWLQSLKNSGNGFGLPYINGALWDTTHSGYSAANMCLDSGGSATVYSGNLRLVDPLLSSWTTTLRTAFNALQATDGSTSEGVYLDVAFAQPAPTCYYASAANYAAWITGMKAVGAAFTDKIVMTESPGEIYLPYIDIAYIYPPTTNDPNAVGLFGFIYGDVDDLWIVGIDGSSTDSDAVLYAQQDIARNRFFHSASLFEGGLEVDITFAALPSNGATRHCFFQWDNNCKIRRAADTRRAAATRRVAW